MPLGTAGELQSLHKTPLNIPEAPRRAEKANLLRKIHNGRMDSEFFPKYENGVSGRGGGQNIHENRLHQHRKTNNNASHLPIEPRGQGIFL